MKGEGPGAGRSWKIALGALIGIFLVAMVATLLAASRGVSRVVDPEYYSHGLHYGQERKRDDTAKGWRLAPALARDGLLVSVADSAGAPVSGGSMTVDMEGGAGNGPGARLVLAELRPGVYRSADARFLREGIRGTIRFSRGDAAISGKVVIFN